MNRLGAGGSRTQSTDSRDGGGYFMTKRMTCWSIAAMASLILGVPQLASAAGVLQAPTFTKEGAPIMMRSCVQCHRPGQVEPMSLLTYEDARPWARSIKTRVTK